MVGPRGSRTWDVIIPSLNPFATLWHAYNSLESHKLIPRHHNGDSYRAFDLFHFSVASFPISLALLARLLPCDFPRHFPTRMLPQLKFSFLSFSLSPLLYFIFFVILIPANNLIKRCAFYMRDGFVWHVLPHVFPLALCVLFRLRHCWPEFSLSQTCWRFVNVLLHAYPLGQP